MCGFAGFVGAVENREEVLENMMNTIVHRGPDSEGKYVDADAALGFRRLSIIDLSKEGDQPLYNEDKTKVLVFNGEIYNYQEPAQRTGGCRPYFRVKYRFGDAFARLRGVGEALVDRLRGCTRLPSGTGRRKSCSRPGIFSASSPFTMHR